MKSVPEIQKIMSNIKYGYIKNGTVVENADEMDQYYHLQSPDLTLKAKIGVCWDQVELERILFKGYDFKTYFIVYCEENNCPTHTFLVYKLNNMYYWFENSWEAYSGIHEYDSLDHLLADVSLKHIKYIRIKDFNPENLYIYEYQKPKYGISANEFYKHCEAGNLVSQIAEIKKGIIKDEKI